MGQKDLGPAYVRAGSTFDGALSQYFVVLVDDHDGQRTRTGANRSSIGRRGGQGPRGRGARGGTRGGLLPGMFRPAFPHDSDDAIIFYVYLILKLQLKFALTEDTFEMQVKFTIKNTFFINRCWVFLASTDKDRNF